MIALYTGDRTNDYNNGVLFFENDRQTVALIVMFIKMTNLLLEFGLLCMGSDAGLNLNGTIFICHGALYDASGALFLWGNALLVVKA